MTPEPVLNLAEIQGVITPGFNKDFQHLLFLAIEDVGKARETLHALGREIASAQETLAARALWRSMRARLGHEPGPAFTLVQWGCALSATGLEKLIGESDVSQFADEAFRLGMAVRAEMLGDPADGEGSPRTWSYGGDGKPVDVLVIAAADSEAALEEACAAALKRFAEGALRLVHHDRGRVAGRNAPGHEHFGFRDGVSQPAMRGRNSERPGDYYEARTWPFEPDLPARRTAFAGPGRPLIWPGHFLFGYPRQFRDRPDELNPKDKAKGPPWAENGSFLVVRRLRQEVAKFDAFLATAAAALRAELADKAPAEATLGALLVGRWKSGSPITLRPKADTAVPESCLNEFSFSTARRLDPGGGEVFDCPADVAGLVCPLGSHIRKVNPRDDTTDLGNPERTLQKLLLRRGITFDRTFDPVQADERGLLFMSYQSSIVSQFEFLMTDWVNRPERPVDGGGHDPILAQGADRAVKLKLADRVVSIPLPGSWVVTTGGAYMFTPSCSFFSQKLAP